MLPPCPPRRGDMRPPPSPPPPNPPPPHTPRAQTRAHPLPAHQAAQRLPLQVFQTRKAAGEARIVDKPGQGCADGVRRREEPQHTLLAAHVGLNTTTPAAARV